MGILQTKLLRSRSPMGLQVWSSLSPPPGRHRSFVTHGAEPGQARLIWFCVLSLVALLLQQ
jgi:hypothetical protein